MEATKSKKRIAGKFVTVLSDINCLSCGVSFHPRKVGLKCCSLECRKKNWASKKIEKLCIVCLESFKVPSWRPTAKYCSLQCHTKSGCLTRKGIKNSEETKEKCRIANLGKKFPERSGELHSNWIKDRTKLKISDDRYSTQYMYFIYQVRKRDNNKCKISNEECKGRLEVHHILNWIDYPELRYDINNCITLCQLHHPHGRKKEIEFSLYFSDLLNNIKNI